MKTKTLTVLQVDIVGSTTTAAAISRQQMSDYIDDVCSQIIYAIKQYGGNPFKFTGDGYLATFESASDCLQAALKIQRDLQTRNLKIGGKAAGTVRIAAHTTDVVVTADDIIGDGVAIVARLEKLTPAGGIYITETTRGICKRAEFDLEYVDTFALRGLPEPIRVYELRQRDKLVVEKGVFVLVSDIKRFSALTTNLAPAVLESYLSALHDMHRQAAKTFSGMLTKIMGDKVLLTFNNADDAAAAAIALQEGATTHCQQRPELPPIFLTISITSGEVYRFSGDMYGTAVNYAFLLASRLDDYRIVLEETVYEQLTIDHQIFQPITDTIPEWPDCPLGLYAKPRSQPIE